MSGLIISVVSGLLINILTTDTTVVGPASRNLLYMVPSSLTPIYWIYKSEKLQEVMWISLNQRNSRIIVV